MKKVLVVVLACSLVFAVSLIGLASPGSRPGDEGDCLIFNTER